MPFPWKKNKVARISNFVADLHSPKRGGSLVVQTGFPTSLIDLFVKNRSRFKKPKPNKPGHCQIPDPPPPTTPPPPEPPRTSAPSNNSTKRRHSEAPILRQSAGDDGGAAGSDKYLTGSGSDPNKVIGALMKTLMVLVVTLSVKKLTFGITISAFVLLFIEYAGKHVVSCLKPCSNARVSCGKFFQNLVSAATTKKTKNREVVLEVCDSVESKSGSSFMQEIVEVVETGNRCDCEESESEVNRFNGEKKKKKKEEQCEEFQCKAESKTKRSTKLKSKIVMKFVPKKLRGSKKEKRIRGRETESSQCSEVEEEEDQHDVASLNRHLSMKMRCHSLRELLLNSAVSKELVIKLDPVDTQCKTKKEEEEDGEEKQDNGSKLECIEDDDEVDYRSTYSNQFQSETYEQEERVESIGRVGESESESSGCLIMLFLIALAGLVEGRFLALILTITWIFMLKMLKKSKGRSSSECTS